MNKCAYCSLKKESSYLKCTLCNTCIHVSCLKCGYVPGGLLGDAFFDFVCFECSPHDKEQLTRQKIPWFIVIVLTLYNLHRRSEGVSLKGYFHYRMHIGNFIDKNWSKIFDPSFKKKKSWMGTVSGTLSHFCPIYFLNGNEVVKDNGWWRLTDLTLTPQQILEIHMKTQIGKKKGGRYSIRPTESNMQQNSAPTSPMPGTVDESSLSACDDASSVDLSNLESEQETAPPGCASTELLAGWQSPEPAGSSFKLESSQVFSDYLFNEDENLADMDIDIEDVNSLDLGDPSNEGFQDLDYLLRPGVVYLPGAPNNSFSSAFPNLPNEQESLFPAEDTCTLDPFCEEISIEKHEILEDSGEVCTDEGNSENDDSSVFEKQMTQSLFEITPEEKRIPPWETMKNKCKEAVETRCIPMSEYEELQLLNQLRRASNVKDLPGYARRLYRKLSVRRLKRERCMPVFNLDNVFVAGKTLWRSSCVWAKPAARPMGNHATEHRILDRFYHVPASTRGKSQMQSCPFKFRLMGLSEPTCFISPYTHRQLKPFIRRDYESRPPWLRLLGEIQNRANRHKPDWQPPPRSPIDYSYVRPQHISAINSLCTEFFYPGIDLSEALQYPDFSCVVLYKKLIVGFAFMVPDVGYNETYISYLFTRVEWRRAGIASFMLYHLIQTCMGKDVTLHVSVTNPALILYQKFGFKVEEFVQDFYEKYFPADSKECKHAFFYD